MKALTLIALCFAAFLIFVGLSSRETAGVLSDAVVFIGVLIAVFIAVIRLITFFKSKKNREGDFDDFNL